MSVSLGTVSLGFNTGATAVNQTVGSQTVNVPAGPFLSVNLGDAATRRVAHSWERHVLAASSRSSREPRPVRQRGDRDRAGEHHRHGRRRERAERPGCVRVVRRDRRRHGRHVLRHGRRRQLGRLGANASVDRPLQLARPRRPTTRSRWRAVDPGGVRRERDRHHERPVRPGVRLGVDHARPPRSPRSRAPSPPAARATRRAAVDLRRPGPRVRERRTDPEPDRDWRLHHADELHVHGHPVRAQARSPPAARSTLAGVPGVSLTGTATVGYNSSNSRPRTRSPAISRSHFRGLARWRDGLLVREGRAYRELGSAATGTDGAGSTFTLGSQDPTTSLSGLGHDHLRRARASAAGVVADVAGSLALNVPGFNASIPTSPCRSTRQARRRPIRRTTPTRSRRTRSRSPPVRPARRSP